MRPATLAPHPTTPCAAVRSLTVEIGHRGALRLRYRIRGTIDGLLFSAARDRRGHGPLPHDSPAARRDGLWRHTCCEAFLADEAGPGYREYNFAPSGEWAAWRFDDYRAGMREEPCAAPRIVVHSSVDEFVLEASIEQPGSVGPIGLCCVIEERGGRLSYWALAHPGERPDFHHRGGFLLPLDNAP